MAPLACSMACERTPRTPSVAAVQLLFRLFDQHGIHASLGGSGLLAALGLADTVHDWDVTTGADSQTVEYVLRGLELPYARTPRRAPFATEACFLVDAGDHTIDVLSRFGFDTPAGFVPVPTRTSGTWRGLPLGGAQEWALAYRLMGRHDRAAALERWLGDAQ